MGQFDHRSEDRRSSSEHQAAGEAMRLLREDIESLRHKVSQQLSQDVDFLEARKHRLMDDIEALEQDLEGLKRQHLQLQQDHDVSLSQQQQAQQQLWAKRLAQALAAHFHARLQTSVQTAQAQVNGLAVEAEQQQVAALDATIQSTLQSLQRDLTSYSSSLSQQINRMQSMEQQGEAILEALVARLSQQLQHQMVRPTVSPGPIPHNNGVTPGHSGFSRSDTATTANGHGGIQLPPTTAPASPFSPLLQDYKPAESPRSPVTNSVPAPAEVTRPGPTHSLGAYRSPSPNPVKPRPDPVPPSQGDRQSAPSGVRPPASIASASQTLYRGLVFMVLSTMALSMHNVIVGIIGYGGRLLGQIPIAGIFPLDIPNSLLLLWLRMVFVLPLLMAIATRLYPPVWEDMRQLMRRPEKRPFYQVVASGIFLFLSQVLIYKAIADVGPGVAVTLLFMYPLVTVPLAWFLFGDRPTSLRLVVMFAISMGIVFTALPRIYMDLDSGSVSIWGVGAAILASIAFALFLVAMQLSFRQLHPVPVSLLQFSTIFILTSLILIIGSFVGFNPGEPSSSIGLFLGGLMLGLLTLLGYLFNNYGVKLMGAAQASIVASSGPVMTAILAYVITPGEKSALSFIQWMGSFW
jgi:drug/metabolite transporter (DMT)-like permease/predicted  nucleic acid-binding Zn-ribbon protein